MHRNQLTAVLGAVVFIAAFSLAGCSSAEPKAATSSDMSVATTTKGSSGNSGAAHILVYSINSDGVDLRSIVTGAIGDYGPAVTIYPDGKADPAHSSQLELKLTRGSFRLSIAALNKAFVRAASHEPIYLRTCSDFFSVTAAAPIVTRSGTGSYRGISGSFQMTATLDEVEANSCKSASPGSFLWQVISLTGSGTVSP
jgi:hypothetical protein